jgi:hypothetical protein
VFPLGVLGAVGVGLGAVDLRQRRSPRLAWTAIGSEPARGRAPTSPPQYAESRVRNGRSTSRRATPRANDPS